eukprot:8846296-Lingulodinium_polyedra.AAC.1
MCDFIDQYDVLVSEGPFVLLPCRNVGKVLELLAVLLALEVTVICLRAAAEAPDGVSIEHAVEL